MLIRSYHKVLLRLSRSFCTDQGNKGSNNNQPGQVPKNEKKIFDKQKQKGGSDKKWGKNWAGKHKNSEPGKLNQAQSNVRSEQQKFSPKKQSVFKNKHKKDEAHEIKNRKDETDETKERKSDDRVNQRQQKKVRKQHPRIQVNERFDWQQNKISKEKKKQHKEQQKMKQSFLEHYKNQTIRAELQKEMKQKKGGQNLNLVTNMQFYFEENSKEARQFFMTQILPLSKNQQAFQKTATKIFQAALFKYIEKQRYSDLLLFLSGLGDNHNLKINNQTIFQYIELILETSSQTSKYTVISLLLDFVNSKDMNKDRDEAIGVGKQILRSYCNLVVDKSQVKKEERHLIINLVNKLAQKKCISSNIFSTKMFNVLVEKVYFPLGSYQLNNFISFLQSIEQGKTESKLHYSQFYINFERSIENYLLSKTDCQGLPAYINSNFFQTYQKCLKDNNWYGILTLIALSLTNKYTSIAQHFLKEGKKKFPYKTQNPILLKQLQDKYRLQKYENIFTSSTQNSQIAQIQSNIKNEQRIQNKLMLAIIKKDYEEAMNIFNNSIFYPLCVNKQALIIKKVLKDFIKEHRYTNSQVNARELNAKIDAFVDGLDKGYLLESWKKGQDLGYLLEDYYIKQGDLAQSKTEKRFSFYDSFFEIKRAKQINKLQKINQLQNFKQGQTGALLEDQFNLNKYLQGESYTRYRQVADYNDQKQQQLAEYFIKIQHGLEYLEKEAENKQQYTLKLISFQKNLCEENLKLLQDFGLRDYDLTQYDIKEFKNRMKNFKKFRGVLRVADIDKRIFPDQNQFDFLQILYEEKYKDHKKMREGKGIKSRRAAMDEDSILQQQGEDIPEQIKDAEQEAIEAQIKEEEEIVEQSENKKKSNKKVNASEGEQGEVVEASEVAEEGAQDVESQTQQPLPIIDHISTKKPAQILKQADSLDKFLTTEFVDILRVQRRDDFQRARQGILFKQHSLAYELILWGVFNKQPMAIYMGQKLYMLSNRKIPHKLAIRVSDFLSYRRQQNEQKIKDCKICLSHIGRIQRQFIYNENYDYHHIHSRPFLKNQIRNYNNELKQRLNDLVYESNEPAFLNMQIREQINKVAKGSLL